MGCVVVFLIFFTLFVCFSPNSEAVSSEVSTASIAPTSVAALAAVDSETRAPNDAPERRYRPTNVNWEHLKDDADEARRMFVQAISTDGIETSCNRLALDLRGLTICDADHLGAWVDGTASSPEFLEVWKRLYRQKTKGKLEEEERKKRRERQARERRWNIGTYDTGWRGTPRPSRSRGAR